MLHTVLFVASVPNNAGTWRQFTEFVDIKLERHSQSVVRLGENVWLLIVQDTIAPLGHLVATAENRGIRYGILPFERAPEWLPTGFDPKTILAQSE